MPPGYEAIHGDDLDTALDSRLAGYERHNRADFKMNCLSDRDSIHARRDMSVEAGLGYEATPCSDSDSIHARRDMIVEKPPAFRATHDDDLDTVLDLNVAGFEAHSRP